MIEKKKGVGNGIETDTEKHEKKEKVKLKNRKY
jgi:hypothetical protein